MAAAATDAVFCGAGYAMRAASARSYHEPGSRGGFSVYVPEYYTPDRAMPLVMALHGGSGNGRGFLWSWLRDARSLGAILPRARQPRRLLGLCVRILHAGSRHAAGDGATWRQRQR